MCADIFEETFEGEVGVAVVRAFVAVVGGETEIELLAVVVGEVDADGGPVFP